MTTQLDEAWEAYYDVVNNACVGLGSAAQVLNRAHQHIVRPPRPRVLTICGELLWPLVRSDDPEADFQVLAHSRRYYVFNLVGEQECRRAAEYILTNCVFRPRLIHRALRRLQVAREWCLYRAAGAEREIDEIMRQQAAWHAQLMREYHLLQLGGGHS